MVYYCCCSFVCGSTARQPIGVGTQLYLGVSMHWIIDVCVVCTVTSLQDESVNNFFSLFFLFGAMKQLRGP